MKIGIKRSIKKSIKSLGDIIPTLKKTIIRFPVPFFLSIAATFIALLLNHKVDFVDETSGIKLLSFMAYAVIALTSLKLLVESARWSSLKHLLSRLMISLIIIGYVWGIIVEEAVATYIYLTLAVVSSLLFSPYITRKNHSDSVWYFNYQNGVAVFFAGIAAIVLGAGASLILVSIDYLFEIDISSIAYSDVWLLSFGLLFPIYILSNITLEFDFENDSCDFPMGISFITNYILVPLMSAYMVILYAYFLKIVVQWELPRGNLGWMITTFGCIGIVTKLLAYPIRNQGTRLLALFDKYYYHALIIPILLLAIAIGIRINEYGVTEQRYGVVLLGLWFSCVATLTFIKRERFEIKQTIMVLSLLSILASFGPWGAVAVSLNSQSHRFESFLETHNLMFEGQAIKANTEISFQDRKTLSSISDYLTIHDYRFERIRPLLQKLMDEEKPKQINTKVYPRIDTDTSGSDSNRLSSRQLLALLGITYVSRWTRDDEHTAFNYQPNLEAKKSMIDTTHFDLMTDNSFFRYRSKTDLPLSHDYTLLGGEELSGEELSGEELGGEDLVVEFDGESLIVKLASGDQASFNLIDYIRDIQKQGHSQRDTLNKNQLILDQESLNNSFSARLIVKNIGGTLSKNDLTRIDNIKYILMLKINK